MLARRMLLLVLALVAAGATAYLARSWVEGQRRPAVVRAEKVEPATKRVLVAARRLVQGSFVTQGALRWQVWPDVDLPDSYFEKGAVDPADLAGAVVRRPLEEGDPVTRSAVVRPGERGFLAAVLEPGMQAVSVPVDQASGSTGLIFPGDRVDVLLTQALEVEGGGGQERFVAETVLRDVRVIAVGQRLSTAAEGADELSPKIRTATLEVTPEGARRLALALELGKLWLGLRSLARPAEGERLGATAESAGDTPIWDSEVSRARGASRSVAVFRGSEAARVPGKGSMSP